MTDQQKKSNRESGLAQLTRRDVSGYSWQMGGIALVIGNGPTAEPIMANLNSARFVLSSHFGNIPNSISIFVCNDASKAVADPYTLYDGRAMVSLTAVSSAFTEIDYARKVLNSNVFGHVIASPETFTTLKKVFIEREIPPWYTVVAVEEAPISFNPHPPFCNFGMSHLVTFQFLVHQRASIILLAGFDMDYKTLNDDGSDPNHYYDSYWSGEYFSNKITPEYARQLNEDQMLAHTLAYCGMKEAGIKVYNTTGGPLSAYYEDLKIW